MLYVTISKRSKQYILMVNNNILFNVYHISFPLQTFKVIPSKKWMRLNHLDKIIRTLPLCVYLLAICVCSIKRTVRDILIRSLTQQTLQLQLNYLQGSSHTIPHIRRPQRDIINERATCLHPWLCLNFLTLPIWSLGRLLISCRCKFLAFSECNTSECTCSLRVIMFLRYMITMLKDEEA